MIPVLIGAAALWGISNMDEAKHNANRANEINKEAAQIANTAHERAKNSHEKMTRTLNKLGNTKMNLMSGNIKDVADTMSKLYKKCKINHDTQGLRELEDNGFNEKSLAEVEQLSQKAVAISSTADFNLNVDGSLCTIGALGGADLGLGTIAAPAFLIYSFMKSDEAEAALYEAKTRLDEARYYDERSKNICALFNAISIRGTQINDLLNKLNYYFDSAVAQLKEVNRLNDYSYSFKNYSREHKAVVFYSWQLMETVKTIVDTSMIQEDWSINPDIEKPMEIGQQTFALLES